MRNKTQKPVTQQYLYCQFFRGKKKHKSKTKQNLFIKYKWQDINSNEISFKFNHQSYSKTPQRFRNFTLQSSSLK